MASKRSIVLPLPHSQILTRTSRSSSKCFLATPARSPTALFDLPSPRTHTCPRLYETHTSCNPTGASPLFPGAAFAEAFPPSSVAPRVPQTQPWPNRPPPHRHHPRRPTVPGARFPVPSDAVAAGCHNQAQATVSASRLAGPTTEHLCPKPHPKSLISDALGRVRLETWLGTAALPRPSAAVCSPTREPPLRHSHPPGTHVLPRLLFCIFSPPGHSAWPPRGPAAILAAGCHLLPIVGRGTGWPRLT